ncbi:TetR/AcrR family transcriptional regulator [Arthrobacter sp. E918]|uniref:TetR/AcrR family transcriptional regulator n=1 Tax=Arthrobacter mobilis TaxID=2724944 RepID=A0A7X6HCA8_9MICC|nr:TetR/AcrR family transcriptional regulator [Arthrobacter mobilis]
MSAAVQILDEHGLNGLTFARLGKQLGASPTAMYRHFSSREEILIAVADELVRQSIDGYVPAVSWLDSLRDLAYRAWRTFERHPAAAAQTYHLLTGGPNELRVVDAILAALHQAGWRGEAAVKQYHMYSQFVLAVSGSHAAQVAQDDTGSSVASTWVQEYRPARPEDYPYVSAVREELRSIDFFEVYVGLVDALLSAMAAQAPAAKE